MCILCIDMYNKLIGITDENDEDNNDIDTDEDKDVDDDNADDCVQESVNDNEDNLCDWCRCDCCFQ